MQGQLRAAQLLTLPLDLVEPQRPPCFWYRAGLVEEHQIGVLVGATNLSLDFGVCGNDLEWQGSCLTKASLETFVESLENPLLPILHRPLIY